MFKTLLLILFGLVTSLVVGQFQPYELGSYTITRFDINHNESLELPYNLDIWSPNEPEEYPIVFFLDSFGAITPGEGYDVAMNHIASHGYMVVNAWRFPGQIVGQDEKVPYFNQTIIWCMEYLENYLYNYGISPGLTINYNYSFGMAHSAGSVIYVEYLSLDCGNFKGLILTSPVDNAGPFPSVPEEGYVDFAIPTIVLPAGLDNEPGINRTLPCGPEERANKHFYDAIHPSVSKWGINSTDYGHGDYMDQEFVNLIIATDFCAYNQDATLEDFDTYRSFIGGQAVTFIKALMSNGDCAEYLDIMENTANMPVAATATNYKPTTCPIPGCQLYS